MDSNDFLSFDLAKCKSFKELKKIVEVASTANTWLILSGIAVLFGVENKNIKFIIFINKKNIVPNKPPRGLKKE